MTAFDVIAGALGELQSDFADLVARVETLEQRPPPVDPPPVDPPTPPVTGLALQGYVHVAANGGLPVFKAGYGGLAQSNYRPDVSLFGSAYTVNSGTWNRDGSREYTLGDGVGQRARVDFANGKTHKAGRIDGSDKAYMADNPTGGWNGYPAQENTLIFGNGNPTDLAADPAVFPGDRGPHLHTFGHVNDSYWNEVTARLADTDNDDLSVPRSSIVSALANQDIETSGFTSMQLGYWPTFVDPIVNNGRAVSWYVGRPRNVAWLGGPTWEGDVIDAPQGLRVATFKTNYFESGGRWRFVARFPCWWNGTDLWLPGSAHLIHGDDPGAGPGGTHPYALPMVHVFVDVDRASSLSEPIQSAQVVNANPAAMMHGRRRDHWNYSNVNVPPHAELMLLWDPVFSNFVTWAVNNRFGLGRIGRDF